MNKKIIFLIFFIVVITVVIAIIFTINNKEKNTQNSLNIAEEFNNNEINNTVERNETMKLYIKVNNKILTATLENNSSVDELLEKLEIEDITINMKDYANFEKVGSLGFNLTRNDKQITTEAGDLILYQGNQFVIYYDTNSWNFTKLGHIDNMTIYKVIKKEPQTIIL